MKKWNSPAIEELELKDTTCPFFWWFTDELSGEGEITPQLPTPTPTPGAQGDQDLGTCNNPYWAGNGLTKEEAQANNPFWGGSWGQ